MNAFYEPVSAGVFDLGVSQKNKAFVFKSTEGVFSSNSEVRFYYDNTLVKRLDLSEGLQITGNNVQGEEKTMTVTVDGSYFVNNRGCTIDTECSFFVDGDVEVIFKLEIK